MGAFMAMEEDLTTCCGLRLFVSFPPEAPRRVSEAERFLAGRRLDGAVLEEAGILAARSAIRQSVKGGEALWVARLIRHTILEALTRIRAAALL